MSQDYQQQKPLPKTAFNEYKLRILGPIQDGAKFPSALQVSVIKNQPRLDVFTNIPNDRDYGKISAPMDSLTAMAVIMELERIIDGDNDTQVKIVNKSGWKESIKVISNTYIGKDKEGRVWISITAQDRAKIKFVFLPSEWHMVVHRDGTPYSEAELSVVYARAWVNLFKQLIPNVLDTHYMEPEPRQDKGGYQKKGGGYQGKSNYQNKPQPATVDDDFDNFPM